MCSFFKNIQRKNQVRKNSEQDKKTREITLHFLKGHGAKHGLIYGKYAGIGTVLKRSAVDASEYGPFDIENPTGFRTGICIDVKILKGIVVSRGMFHEGDVVEGICSYGGDEGVAGNPDVGDVVGFYLGYYARIWEKIDPSVLSRFR